MKHAEFIGNVRLLAGMTSLFSGEELETVFIYNPRAGGFSSQYSLRQATKISANAVAHHQISDTGRSWRVIATEGKNHARQIASELLDEAAMRHRQQWLVIIAAGDGTCHEFLDTLSRAPDDPRERFTIHRLPMGTGNDGADGRDLAESLSRLYPGGEIRKQAAVRVIPARGGPAFERLNDGEWRSFNIASIGLDAYVTSMTNKLKSFMPGDSYKLWLDLASIFFDRVYPLSEMKISAFSKEGRLISEYEGQFLLLAFGVSGRRTYGSNKPILPDDDNVCTVRQMPFLRKMKLKTPIASGRHREFPEAILFSAHSLEVQYASRTLVQMDGEDNELEPEDFPLRFELTEPIIRHLGPKT